MLAKDAKRLADLLIGLEDAKADLIEAYKTSMEADVVPHSLIESAERWMEIADDLVEYTSDPGSDNSGGPDDIHSRPLLTEQE